MVSAGATGLSTLDASPRGTQTRIMSLYPFFHAAIFSVPRATLPASKLCTTQGRNTAPICAGTLQAKELLEALPVLKDERHQNDYCHQSEHHGRYHLPQCQGNATLLLPKGLPFLGMKRQTNVFF